MRGPLDPGLSLVTSADSLAERVAELSAKVEGLQTDLMVKLSKVSEKLFTVSTTQTIRCMPEY